MLDFHCHFLPGIDDGAEDASVSYRMLRMSREQGVDTVVATPHYYPDEESPEEFLVRRSAAVDELRNYIDGVRAQGEAAKLPTVLLGAEVYFFPAMADCESVARLAFGQERYLLVEPPMCPWPEAMLDEIRLAGERMDLKPVIAHVDRYVRMLKAPALFRRLEERGIPAQVNASFFLHRGTRRIAFRELKAGRIAFLGSDAHDLKYRPPNLQSAAEVIASGKHSASLDSLFRSF